MLRISTLILSLLTLSACANYGEYAYSQHKKFFNHIPEHQGLTLKQATLSPTAFMSSGLQCFAALETKFTPREMKSPQDILIRIKEAEAFQSHATNGRINGKFVEYNGELRAYGIACRVAAIEPVITASAFCGEVNNQQCITLVISDAPQVDITPKLYDMLAEARRRSQISKTPETKEEYIISIEKTCMGFGYTKGSEKFADCMKDLYLKETNSKQQSVQNNSASDAQLQVLRQQLELQRQQAAAAAEAENRRQGQALMDLGNSLLNPSPPPSNRPLTCRTMSNGITTCQ